MSFKPIKIENLKFYCIFDQSGRTVSRCIMGWFLYLVEARDFEQQDVAKVVFKFYFYYGFYSWFFTLTARLPRTFVTVDYLKGEMPLFRAMFMREGSLYSEVSEPFSQQRNFASRVSSLDSWSCLLLSIFFCLCNRNGIKS